MSYSFNKILLCGGLMILAGQSTSAQGSLTGISAQNNVKAAAGGAMFQTFDNRYEGVRGNPFFVDAWLPGSIVVKKNNSGATEEFKNLKLKYDVHGNQVAAVVAETKDTVLINANIVSSFKVEIPSYPAPVEFRILPEARTLDPKLANVFFAVLYDGNTKFVKGVTKVLVKADFKGGYSVGSAYDEIVDEAQYYLLAGNRLVKTKLTRKSLLDALPAQQEKIKNFIASHKLAMNTEADFIKVLAYQETL